MDEAGEKWLKIPNDHRKKTSDPLVFKTYKAANAFVCWYKREREQYRIVKVEKEFWWDRFEMPLQRKKKKKK
jgi:hypothetical protein